MSPLQPVRGTHDLLPEEFRKHLHLLQTARDSATRYGFEEIATPIFEATEVFSRTLGDSTDIVNKEMYTFQDRNGDWMTLRPEGTAGVARAFISEGLAQNLPLKLFYQGPMFRYERPQKGRQRQFHQLGVELLGVEGAQADIEVIALAMDFLNDLKISTPIRLEINSIGDAESRLNYRKALVGFLQDKKSRLSEESQRRLESNPLRILDSKDENDQHLMASAPLIADFLNAGSRTFFQQVLSGLKALGVAAELNPKLVRGLDYYRHCVFECTCENLGAQKAVLAGGRYDGLIESMGGPSTPGVGWAAGLERLALLLTQLPTRPRPIALVPLGEEAEFELLSLAHRLRQKGLVIEMAYTGNLSKRMKKANKINAVAAVIVGPDELQRGEATVKDLDSGAQVLMRIAEMDVQLKEFLATRTHP